jgi:hypothetical protein
MDVGPHWTSWRRLGYGAKRKLHRDGLVRDRGFAENADGSHWVEGGRDGSDTRSTGRRGQHFAVNSPDSSPVSLSQRDSSTF